MLTDFSNENVVCAATLNRDTDGIHATAAIPLTPGTKLAMMHESRPLWHLWPYLALSIAYASVEEQDGTEVVTSGRVAAVSLCTDPGPDAFRWEVISSERDAA